MRMRMMMQDRRKSNESSTSHQDGRKKEPSYNYPPSRPNRIVHHNNFVEDDNNNDDKSNILISSSRGGGGVAVVPSVVSLEASQEAAVPTTKVSSSHFYSRKSLQDPSFYHVFAGSEKNNSINNNNNHAIGVSLTQSPPPPPPVFDNLCWAAGIQRPSKIQAISWPTVLKGDHCIIADQTGSGKTYAYLFPLLQRMVYKNDHQPSSSSSSVLSVAAPQLLILAPTSELADQIHMVVSKLLLGIMNQKNRRRRYRATVLTGTGGHATNIRDQIRFLEQQQQQIDILISTPGRIGTILRMRQCQSRILSLERITAVVFDEVDILLLDPSFAPQLETIGQAIQTMSCTAIVNDRTTTTTSPSSSSNSNQNKNVQFVFCTATLPDKVLSTIRGQFPAVELCLGPGLHKIAPTVKDTLIDVSVATTNQNNDLDYKKDGTMIKNDAVLNALRLNRCRRTLIFANTVSSCRAVVNAIQRHDRSSQLYWVDSYHNAMTIPSRQKALQTFIRADDNMDNNNNNNQIHQNNKSYILVATDRAARGVELGIVDHVIIYDFGNSPAEYMRRVGRTARAGRSGSVTVLAYGWQLPIARQLLVSSKSTSNTTTKATTKPGSQDDTKADDDSKNRSRKKKRQSSLSSSSLDEGMFAKDDNGGSDEEEWSFRKKKQQQLRAKPFNYIGESIANGKLWTEREDQNHNNNDR